MAHLTLGVLGALQVTRADGETVKFQSDQTRALLAYLAVESDRPHRREALTGLLWPDDREEAARHNLRQALLNLRHAIGDADANAHPPYLLITRPEIQFNTASNFALDVASFDAHLAATASHSHPRLDDCAICAPRLQQAVDLYRGQFLQEFFLKNSAAFEEWALARREAFHHRVLEALSALGTYYEQHGDLGATRRSASRALELDPWREQAYRQLMRVFAREGQNAAALAQYETCRRALADGMDVEPSPETRELYERIRTGSWKLEDESRKQSPTTNLQSPISRSEAETPRTLRGNLSERSRRSSDLEDPRSEAKGRSGGDGDTAAGPARPSGAPFAGQLPTSLTPFIGRERELADLARLIGDPSCRLITLVGSGGMGKTRLAVQAASHSRNAFAQDVVFVPLVAINSVEAIVPAIADALGFSFYGPNPPRLQLFSYLRDKRALLILDNVEQLLGQDPDQGDATDLLIGLLEHTSGIKLLVTSREPLNVQGEWVYPVEGLQTAPGDPSEAIESSAAAALFVQRAKRARAGFTLSERDYPELARLCRLVDGSPLALELAATWTRTLSVVEIVKEIERNLDFLSTTVRDLPERHRSMRAVFNHSWKLLTEPEQRVLLRLSVFHGGFRREAAEDVAGATLSVLSSLISKSLVRRSSDNRYDMHELIRQFATGYYSAHPEEQKETQTRHGKYYLTSFARADGRMRSPAQREALAEWTAEIDNIRVAWNWAVAQSEFGLIEETLRAFAMLYETRGWYQEGLDMLGRAIDALELAHGPSPADRTAGVALGHLLTNRALLTYRLGRHADAQTMLERSLDILRPLNDARYLVEPMTYLGAVMALTGDYASALDLFADAREKALAVGDRIFAATNLSLHAHYSRLTGQSGDQHGRLRAAVAEWRAVGDPRFTAYGLNFLGQSALALGRFDEARQALEESVELNTSVGARWNLGHAFQGLGAVAQAQGEHQRAADLFRQAVNTFAELGGRFYMGQGLAQMGQSLFALGNDVEAERVWRKSLRIAAEIRGIPVVLETLVGLASLQAKRRDAQPALELLLIVLNHPACDQETKDRAEQMRRELERQLTAQQIQAAQAKAGNLRIEQVVNQALEQA